MKLNKFTAIISAVLVFLLPLSALADRRNYRPPAEKGYVYIVVRYRQTFGPQPTQVSVSWGNWQKSGNFSPPKKLLLPGSGVPEGIVIKLRHSKNDSIEMTVESNGSINYVSQGDPPSAWNQKEYEKVNW